MSTTITMGSALGWSVTPEPTDAYGVRAWKWTAFSSDGSFWGTTDTEREAIDKARAALDRLTEGTL